MLHKVIEWSAHNKAIVFLFTAIAVVFSIYCIKNSPLDAIPDLSDTQVIIYSKWDRSPDIMEDQVTYPIISSLLGAPKVKAVRGLSDFGFSYVYVIFEDGTDLYWARSRVLEYLSKILPRLPPEVKTEIGPDATSLGWIYQYTIVDNSKNLNLAELRSIQDWQLKFHLESVPGVSEVASIGGFVKQYQVNVDPTRLSSYRISINQLVTALRQSNTDTGGRVIEFSGTEYMVRGRGYIKNIEDIKNTVVSSDSKTGTPILVKNLATVELGPDMRRGIADFNGMGDAVGGIVIMRQGENALNVINRVKARIDEIKPSLPPGVEIISTYDRSNLITASINTLKHELVVEITLVCFIIFIFLWHIPSAIVPIITIPISILLAFIPMYFFNVTINIMSLAGIAISIGVLVDGAIIEVENAYKRLEHWKAQGEHGDPHLVRLQALKEVGPSVFFSLLVISVSFLPVFTLIDQEGKLFSPLAISKTLTMALAAILAVTLDPALRMLFTRMEFFNFTPKWICSLANATLVGTYYPEEKHPISSFLFRFYEPVVRYVLRNAKAVLIFAIGILLSTIPIYFKLGREFMPPLNEGAMLYMPTAFPGMAVTEASKILQAQDKLLKEYPEVSTVFGKAGRADTPTDPAPFSMIETTVILKPMEEWPKVNRWYSKLPHFFHPLFSWVTPSHRTFDELQKDMNEKLKFAGIPNIWTMPIKNRIDMLSTGIRTPVGIKVSGPDLNTIQEISEKIEKVLRKTPGLRNIYAERSADGYYLDFSLKREALARYGISIADAQMVISSAVGGENITSTIEGRERYPVSVRYAREFRENIDDLKRVLVPSATGAQIPMAELADIRTVHGPAMIRNENGLLTGYVYIDVTDRDLASFVDEAKHTVSSQVKIPTGYNIIWSGEYENMERVRSRLKLVIPATIFLIMLLLYMNTKSIAETAIILLAVPFSAVGSIWLLYLLGYNISIAVWIGIIALMGLDAETGVFMLLYLSMAYDEKKKEKPNMNVNDLDDAIIEGAVKRIRPKLMTVMAAIIGLLPIMWSTGSGGDVMRRIAAPMIGGLITSFILELLVYPVVFRIWKGSILGSGKLSQEGLE